MNGCERSRYHGLWPKNLETAESCPDVGACKCETWAAS